MHLIVSFHYLFFCNVFPGLKKLGLTLLEWSPSEVIHLRWVLTYLLFPVGIYTSCRSRDQDEEGVGCRYGIGLACSRHPTHNKLMRCRCRRRQKRSMYICSQFFFIITIMNFSERVVITQYSLVRNLL